MINKEPKETDYMHGALVRLRPPRINKNIVALDRLMDKLVTSSSLALTTIFSSAGYGKTTLLVQFFDLRGKQGATTAWLSLSEAEKDPHYFLNSILCSLDLANDNLVKASLKILQSSSSATTEIIIDNALDEIAKSNASITLILDDFHLAESPSTNNIIERFVERAPRNFSLVISSRYVAKLNLPALEIQGQIAHIQTSDLRLDADESLRFLNETIKLPVNDTETSEIIGYLEGWPMGLQVAAISIEQFGNFEKISEELSQSGFDIFTFLSTDILSALEDDIIQFLRNTVHLEILIPELCDACTEQKNGHKMLAELDRLNLFVQKIHNKESWYQYHHLFRDFLQRHFEASEKTKSYDKHQRAYNWFNQNNLPEYAITQALKAEMWEAAQQNLERIWKPLLTSSRFSQIQKWVSALPKEYVKNSPGLRIALIWVDSLHRHLDVARNQYDNLLEDLKLTPPDFSANALPTTSVEIDLLILKCAIDNMLDDNEEMVKLAEFPYEGFDNLDSFSHGLLLNYIVYARVLAGKFDQADRIAELALVHQIKSGDVLVAIHNLIFCGMGRRMSGDLKGAIRAFSKAADLSWKHLGFIYSATQSLHASVSYEMGDIAAAERYTSEAASASIKPATLDPVIAQYITTARLLCLEDDSSKALEVLSQAEAEGRKHGGQRLLVTALTERIKILLSEEKIDAACDIGEELLKLTEGNRQLEHFSWPMTISQVAQARALISLKQGNSSAARKITAPFIIEAESSGRSHPHIRFLVLDALSYIIEEKEKLASRRLSKAISLGAHGQYTQIFLDNFSHFPQVMSSALTRCALDGVNSEYLEMLSNEFGIPIVSWALEQPNKTATTSLDITDREHDLLVALSAGLTNRNIAKDMEISENTVAWHLKNLYAKLEVSSRTGAVNAARKHGLIS